MMTYKIFAFCFLFCSCVSKNNKLKERNNSIIEDSILVNAKWYFYAYAFELQASDKNGNVLKEIDYELKIRRINSLNPDTIRILISAFHGDTLNTCTFRPADILGITVTQNRIYTPIYHQIEFDRKQDSQHIIIMDSLSNNLRDKVLNKKLKTNKWLATEAKLR